MNMTEELAQAAAEQPEGVRLTDPVSRREYVLISAEVFNQLRNSFDDSPWCDDERDALRAEALDELGWEGMDAYQD